MVLPESFFCSFFLAFFWQTFVIIVFLNTHGEDLFTKKKNLLQMTFMIASAPLHMNNRFMFVLKQQFEKIYGASLHV